MQLPPEGLRFDPELIRALRFYGIISLDLVTGPLLGLAFGRHLNQSFGLSPLWTVFGFLAGASLSFFGFYRLTTTEIYRDWRKNREKKGK